MVYVIRSKDWLEHHGIKGQKWGKRNGPPYPLDYNAHSAQEKKLSAKGELDNYKNNNYKSNNANDTINGKKRIEKVSGESNKSYNHEINSNKSVSESKPLGLAMKETNENELRRHILNQNPNAAIFDPSIVSGKTQKNNFFKEHKKEIIVGLGITVTAAAVAAGAAYASNKADIELQQLINEHEQRLEEQKKLVNLSGFYNQSQKYTAAWLSADEHRYDPISLDEFESLDDKPIILKAGTNLFRMSKSEHNSLRDNLEYVSFTEEDRNRYRGFLPQIWKSRGFSSNSVYETVLKAKEQVKAPSKKESILIMERAVKRVSPGHADAVYRDDILKNFYGYIGRMTDRNDPLVKAFIKELQKSGYNAVVDYNDAGRLSDMPMILINGAKSAQVKSINKISRQEAFDIFQNIVPLDKYKDFSVDDFNNLPQTYKFALQRFMIP